MQDIQSWCGRPSGFTRWLSLSEYQMKLMINYLLYERVALLAQGWNIRDNLGLVVGATQPEALKRVRQLVPEMWILAPGVGLQGGDLRQALMAGLRSDGMGMLIPISRGISRASNPRQAAQEICEKINAIRKEISTSPER